MDIPRTPPRRARRSAIAAVAGIALLALATLSARTLRPAAPRVNRSTVWTDTVRRGPLVRQVSGPGKLVPEQVRWLTAPANAQVERVLQHPGASVAADTLVVVLANPELELAALEAERDFAGAQAELVELEATLAAERLAQQSRIATLSSEWADAERRALADAELGRKGFLSELEREQSLAREKELRGRVQFERQRLAALSDGMNARRAAQRTQIKRLGAMAEFNRKQVEALSARANMAGVMQELSLEPGQWVAAGASLGKVIRPDRLKAELRIPETQAKDLQLGQKASIDTRNGVSPGRVSRIDPAAQAGNVRVEISMPGPLPPGARPDLNIEGTIELERLESVAFMGRPAVGQPGTTVSLFKLDEEGNGAERTRVRLGRSSVEHVEVLSGLKDGDEVILSELSQWDEVDRIRLQ